MTPDRLDALRGWVGPNVHLAPHSDSDVGAALQDAWEAAREGVEGRPVILAVEPADRSRGPLGPFLAIPASRLPELFESMQAQRMGVLRRSRRLVYRALEAAGLPTGHSTEGEETDGDSWGF